MHMYGFYLLSFGVYDFGDFVLSRPLQKVVLHNWTSVVL